MALRDKHRYEKEQAEFLQAHSHEGELPSPKDSTDQQEQDENYYEMEQNQYQPDKQMHRSQSTKDTMQPS